MKLLLAVAVLAALSHTELRHNERGSESEIEVRETIDLEAGEYRGRFALRAASDWFDFREGWMGYAGENLSFSAGRQRIEWGYSKESPVLNLYPRDQRLEYLPLLGVSALYKTSMVKLGVHSINEYRSENKFQKLDAKDTGAGAQIVAELPDLVFGLYSSRFRFDPNTFMYESRVLPLTDARLTGISAMWPFEESKLWVEFSYLNALPDIEEDDFTLVNAVLGVEKKLEYFLLGLEIYERTPILTSRDPSKKEKVKMSNGGGFVDLKLSSIDFSGTTATVGLRALGYPFGIGYIGRAKISRQIAAWDLSIEGLRIIKANFLPYSLVQSEISASAGYRF